MKWSIAGGVAVLALLAGCSEEYHIQQAAWEYQINRLKAPSTAKRVDALVVSESSEKENYGFFLAHHPIISHLSKLLEAVANKKELDDEHYLIKYLYKDFNPKYSVTKEEAEGIKAAIKKGNTLAAMDTILKIQHSYVPKVKEFYESEKPKLKFMEVLLTYDAQNSYGAMLREHASVSVVKGLPWERGDMLVEEKQYYVDPSTK